MEAGATDEEAQKVRQIRAHTVRQPEAKYSPPKPGPEARRLLREEMSTDDEFSAGDSTAWTLRARKPPRGAPPTQKQKRDVWQRSTSKKRGWKWPAPSSFATWCGAEGAMTVFHRHVRSMSPWCSRLAQTEFEKITDLLQVW